MQRYRCFSISSFMKQVAFKQQGSAKLSYNF
jgi:hypothetical protein